MLTFINVDAATVQTENEMWKPFKGEASKEAFLNYMNTVFSLQWRAIRREVFSSKTILLRDA